MKVTVKPLKGETFEVEYEPETLVKDLKESIAKLKSDMAVEQQKLIYSGKILNNDTPMKEYGIKEGEFIVVMVAKAKPPAAAAPAPAAPAPAAATTPAAEATPATAPAATPDATQMANSAMPTGAAGMESAIEQLTAMGFERPQVERCLRAAFGNPDRAVEYLMSGIPEGIGAEMAGGGAPPAGGAAPPATGGGEGGGAPTGGAFPAMPTGGAFPAMPTGGGGGGGGTPIADLPPALQELRNSPQFTQLAQLVAAQPHMLQQMLPTLAASHPAAAQAVRENPEAFLRMLQEAAAGGGGGGGGMPGGGMGGGMPGGMPPGGAAQMAAMMAQNPEMVQQIVAEIAQSDPELAAQIQADPQAFARTMQAMAAQGGGGGGMPGGGGGAGGHVVRLTEEESQAVARLTELGFDRQVAAQAYLACDKNEELAANYLFEHGLDGDD